MNKDFKSGLTIPLYPHQINSVKKMEELEFTQRVEHGIMSCDTKMGILGDIPGYGKSYSIISLIARDMMEWKEGGLKVLKISTESARNGLFNFYYQEKTLMVRENLLVVSSSIIHQWKNYFEKSSLKVFMITTKSSFGKFEPNNWDVVLITSSMLNDFLKVVYKETTLCWKRFIYDEPTSVHIPSMRSVSAGFSWFITATHQSLGETAGNRGTKSHFLKSIFGRMSNEHIGMITIANTEEEIKKSFGMPETIFKYHKWCNPSILKVLNKHVSRDVLQMIEANNIKGALEYLGAKEEVDIVSIVTRKKRENLQMAEMKISYYKDKNRKDKYEAWSSKAKILENDIKDIEEKYKNLWENECCICYGNLEDPVLLQLCNHVFCGKCILEWYKKQKTCPLCREKNDITDMIHIEKKMKEKEKIDVLPKSQTIADLVKNRKADQKFIIFSDHDETFEHLKPIFLLNNIKWSELYGRSTTKDKSLNSFRTGDTHVIFLNSKVDSAGINLTECTDIILYHDMGFDTQTQIIGRANRIGRKQNLMVHKFLN